MSETQIITISVPATSTWCMAGNSSSKTMIGGFSIKVSGVADNNDSDSIVHFGLYEWDMTDGDIDDTFFDLVSGTLRSAKVMMYYSNADTPSPIGELGIYLSTVSIASTSNTLFSACAEASTPVARINPVGDLKTKVEYDITELSDIESAIKAQEKFILIFKPTDTSIGGKAKESQILIGGRTLNRGIETNWESGTITDPPRLIMEWEVPSASHAQHLMKYTTSADPYSNQSTPSASRGGYVAPNLVNNKSQIDGDISKVQTKIPIKDEDSLPSTTSGHILVGSEIMSYSTINTDNNEITGITRAVVPPFSYSVSSQPLPEYAHYLSVNSIFDTKPNEDLVQYRCVAIQQQSTANSWETESPQILLTQNPNSDIIIDIGIELPAWDVHYGTFSSETANGTNEIRSVSATSGSTLGAIGYEDGFFNGGQIIIDPDGTDGVGPQNHIIDSYEMDEGVAVFLLEDNLSGTIPVGTTFRIAPAPSQTITNEITPPNNNNGRFLGFLSEGGVSTITLEEHGSTMFNYDVFYVWIKRTLSINKKSNNDSGAIITLLSPRSSPSEAIPDPCTPPPAIERITSVLGSDTISINFDSVLCENILETGDWLVRRNNVGLPISLMEFSEPQTIYIILDDDVFDEEVWTLEYTGESLLYADCECVYPTFGPLPIEESE